MSCDKRPIQLLEINMQNMHHTGLACKKISNQILQCYDRHINHSKMTKPFAMQRLAKIYLVFARDDWGFGKF